MESLPTNFEKMIHERIKAKKYFSEQFIVSIGLTLLRVLKRLHQA